MRRSLRVMTRVSALLLLAFVSPPSPGPALHAAQPPQPVPITDTVPQGPPERVDLDGGRVRLVSKNAAGQTISETVFDPPRMTVTTVHSVYPGGRPAEVTIMHAEPPLGAGLPELVRYDSAGVPQERERFDREGEVRRDRWNPTSRRWEAAPEKERWDPYKGRWEQVPDDERFDRKQGLWERRDPATGEWKPLPQTPEDILEELSPGGLVPAAVPSSPIQATATRGHAVAAEARAGLATTIFSTPRGRLRVNVPDDLAAGDTISGTIYAEPAGRDQREQARNLTELRRYVLEWENRRTPASTSGPSSGTPFTVAIPAAATTTRVILRDKDGREAARRDLPMARPTSVSVRFAIPKIAEKGNMIAIHGPFDGDFGTSNVAVGGDILPKVAESPRQIIVHNTVSQVGLSTCEVTEGTQNAADDIRTVGIALTAPRLELLRGEQTTLTVTVTGLSGIEAPVPLRLENLSPSIVRMAGGERQSVSISPSALQNGAYTTTRTLSSMQRGTFTVTGTVLVASEPSKSETRADLAITKSGVAIVPSGLSDAAIEQAVPISMLYIITVTNNGRNGAQNVVVTDELPAPLTPMACAAHATQQDERGAGGRGTCDGVGNSRRITFPYLAPGATAHISIRALVDPSAAPGPFVNVANVTSLTPDPDPSNNRATYTEQIPTGPLTSAPRPPGLKPPPPDDPPPPAVADLKITKTAAPAVVKAGDRITYTMVVTNLGPGTAVAPLILDAVPVETTFVACTPSRGACRFGVAAGGLVDAVLPDLPNGALETVKVEVDVKTTVGPGTAIINNAEVSSATPDRNPANNKDTAIVWVRAPIPLVVISEFRTRGPQGDRDEFIELYNRSNQKLDLTGWTVAISDGSGATTTLLTIAPGTLLPARGHLLLANEAYSGSIPADQTFAGNIADDGGIALSPLRGIPGDGVGLSNGSAFREGTVLTPLAGDADQSYERRPGGALGSTVDSNNNRADFRPAAPSAPQNLKGAPRQGPG